MEVWKWSVWVGQPSMDISKRYYITIVIVKN